MDVTCHRSPPSLPSLSSAAFLDLLEPFHVSLNVLGFILSCRCTQSEPNGSLCPQLVLGAQDWLFVIDASTLRVFAAVFAAVLGAGGFQIRVGRARPPDRLLSIHALCLLPHPLTSVCPRYANLTCSNTIGTLI